MAFRPEHSQGHRWRQLRARVKRNQGVCWICGGPFDDEFRYPHPLAFTVDHVEPVVMRPDLALVYSNLRAAHNRCNRGRGTGRGVRKRSVNPPSEEW